MPDQLAGTHGADRPEADDRLRRLADRLLPEPDRPWSSPYQEDRVRIIQSKAFRRLAHKTQVFIASNGDHYRTRLTHTLEVALIARTMARALSLDEDLAEAVSLGHDLGHTPFGHAGERVLNLLTPGGFHHQRQSLRVVERLARGGRGLNLTRAVLDGIGKHSKGRGPIFVDGPARPLTLEGELVRAADIIAYLAHDLDDALEAGLVEARDVPAGLEAVFGPDAETRRDAMVGDLLASSAPGALSFSKAMAGAMERLRTFLHQRVYQHPELNAQLEFGRTIINLIYQALMSDDRLYESIPKVPDVEGRSQAACDFISGMTDRYALQFAENLGRHPGGSPKLA
jgi:dGTPase